MAAAAGMAPILALTVAVVVGQAAVGSPLIPRSSS